MEAQSSISFVYCSSCEHINVRASEIVVLLEGSGLYCLAQFRQLPKMASFVQNDTWLQFIKTTRRGSDSGLRRTTDWIGFGVTL